MRTRTQQGPACPIIRITDYVWSSGLPANTAMPNVREMNTPSPLTSTPKYWTVPNGYPTWSEVMTDDTGTDGRYRDCLHTLESNEFGGGLVNMAFASSCVGNTYLASVQDSDVQLSLAEGQAPDIDMDAYASQALAFMLPSVNEGSSLVNFLLELKDVKRMDPRGSIRRIFNRRLALRHLSDPKTRKKFLRELTGRLAGAHLNVEFGIKPFIRDVVQLYDDLTTLHERLEKLRRFAGRRLTRHYKRTLPSVSGGGLPDTGWNYKPFSFGIPWNITLGVSQSPDYNFQNRPPMCRRVGYRWIQRPIYRASMRYSYELPGDSLDAMSEIRARLDSLGVRLDPSIIWNAIPFSFLVDWVVDISSFLRSFARDNWPIKTHIHDFCHSMTWSKEVVLEWNIATVSPYCSAYGPNFPPVYPGDPLGDQNHLWFPVYKGERYYYNRKTASPSTHAVIAQRPGLRQAALSGSLILANTRATSDRSYLRLRR